MGLEAFHPGKLLYRFECAFERGPIIFHHAGPALELIDRQAGKRRSCATGRKGMAWSCYVIPQHCRRITTDENGACSHNSAAQLTAFADHDFTMLRRQPVCEGDSLIER